MTHQQAADETPLFDPFMYSSVSPLFDWDAMGDPLHIEHHLDEHVKGADWTPKSKTEITDAAFLVQVYLPDVHAKQVHVKIDKTHTQLIIYGERPNTTQSIVQEEMFGHFGLQFALPAHVDTSKKMVADLKEGRLRIRVPLLNE